MFIASLVCNMPQFWAHKFKYAYDRENNKSYIFMVSSDLADNDAYKKVYPWIVDGLLLSILPFFLLLTLNVRLIWEVMIF